MTEYSHDGSPEIPVVFSEKCRNFGLSLSAPDRALIEIDPTAG
jgi:hypothetical protein